MEILIRLRDAPSALGWPHSQVPWSSRLKSLLKATLRSYGFRAVSYSEVPIHDDGPLTPEQAAELIISSRVAWSGPAYDVVLEAGPKQRLVVHQGDGNAERSFAEARILRAELIDALAGALRRFAANRQTTPAA